MFDLIRRMARVMEAHHPLWNLEPGSVVCTCGEWKGNIDDDAGGRVTAEYHRYHVAEALLQVLGSPQYQWAHIYKGYSGNWSLPIPAPTKERAEKDAEDYKKVFGDKIPDADSIVVWQAVMTTDWFEKEKP